MTGSRTAKRGQINPGPEHLTFSYTDEKTGDMFEFTNIEPSKENNAVIYGDMRLYDEYGPLTDHPLPVVMPKEQIREGQRAVMFLREHGKEMAEAAIVTTVAVGSLKAWRKHRSK